MRPAASKSKQESATDKFLLCLTRELKARIKLEAHRKFGDRRGAESMYVEEAMRIYLHMNVEGVEES